MLTARRARSLVAEMWAPRFSSNDYNPAKDLKKILDYQGRSSLLQFLCLFTSRAQLIFHDFMSRVFWPAYEGGRSIIGKDEIADFIVASMDEGRMQKRWSESTVKRVSGYLIGTAIDFEFARKIGRTSYELTPPTIDDKVALY